MVLAFDFFKCPATVLVVLAFDLKKKMSCYCASGLSVCYSLAMFKEDERKLSCYCASGLSICYCLAMFKED